MIIRSQLPNQFWGKSSSLEGINPHGLPWYYHRPSSWLGEGELNINTFVRVMEDWIN